MPDHPDVVLSAAEKAAAADTTMICCSGALSVTLMLDIWNRGAGRSFGGPAPR